LIFTPVPFNSDLLVGAYAEWLSSHPDYLRCVLPIILFGLTNAEVAPAATLALKVIYFLYLIELKP